MARKRYSPEQIIGKLRAIEVHLGSGMRFPAISGSGGWVNAVWRARVRGESDLAGPHGARKARW